MSSTRILVAALALAFAGCATRVQTVAVPMRQAAPPPPAAAADEVDLMPPVPSFTSASDCELAYGTGACGTGAEVYSGAALEAPPGAATWFIPFAYGAMTGVLLNRYFAPPAVYVSTVEYRTFVAPVVVQRYRVVDRTTIEVYRRAPQSVRIETVRSGPVRYAPSRGVVTAHPYARPADGHPVAESGFGRGRPDSHPSSSTSLAPTAPHSPGLTPPTSWSHNQAAPQPTPTTHTEVTRPATPTPPPTHTAAVAPVAMPKHEALPAAPTQVVKSKGKPCNPALPKSSANCA